MIKIEISNLDQVVAKVLSFVGRFDGAEAQIMAEWTECLDAAVKPNAPVDTGYLLSCIHPEYGKDGKIKDFFYGIRDQDCEYAKFTEYSWGGRHAWFNRSVESAREKMNEIYHQVLLERAGLR